MVGAERKVTKFFQTPVEIDEARTMSRALLNHRVQELRNLHGQEWILAMDGSFDSKTNDPLDGASSCLVLQVLAGCSAVLRKPRGIWKDDMVKKITPRTTQAK